MPATRNIDAENSSAAGAAPFDKGPATAPASTIEACTRCGLSLKRAMMSALFVDLGGRTNINPLQCALPSGKMADHDFQIRGA